MTWDRFRTGGTFLLGGPRARLRLPSTCDALANGCTALLIIKVLALFLARVQLLVLGVILP